MKLYNFLLLTFAFCALTLFNSCGNDDEDMPTSIVFNCKVDGVAWEADRITISIIGGTDYGNDVTGKAVSIFAEALDGSRINLVLSDFEANNNGNECISEIDYYGLDHVNESQNKQTPFVAGEFLENSCTPVYYPLGTNVLEAFIGGNSNIKITNCDSGKLSGEFNFIGNDLGFTEIVTITEGKFEDIAYTYQ